MIIGQGHTITYSDVGYRSGIVQSLRYEAADDLGNTIESKVLRKIMM